MLKLNPKFVKPLDYIFIFNPISFFVIWVWIALGSGSGRFFAGQGVWWLDAVTWQAVAEVGFLTIALGIAHYFAKFGFSAEKIEIWEETQLIWKNPKRTAIILWMLAGFALAGLLILDVVAGAIAILLFLLNGYLSGTTLIRQRSSVGWRLIIAILSGYGLFLFGWQIAIGVQMKALLYGLPYLLGWLAVYLLISQYSDHDLLLQDETTEESAQPNRILIWIAAGLYVLAFAGGIIARDPVLSVAAMLASPLFIILVFRPKLIWLVRTSRYAFLFIALVICVEYPWLFAVLLVNYYVWKFYYYNRWDVNYPTFQV